MVGKLFSTLGRVCHTSSGFGDYFVRIQHRCLKSGRSSDCEGNPTMAEARKDFLATMPSKYSNLLG